MTIHIHNCFTCNMRWPGKMKTGTVCTLVETDQGLVLIDTGPGTDDVAHPTGILKLFRILFQVPLKPQEMAIQKIQQLGYQPEDVRNIVLTHMHFDHCGELQDFPKARVHVHRNEYEAFRGGNQHWSDLGYMRRYARHNPEWVLYDTSGEHWYDFDSIRLPFEPEIWLIPLHGHSRGHCGVAVKLEDGWYFNAGDAGAIYNDQAPAWLIRWALGPHDSRLRTFHREHPEVRMVTSHMWLDWFDRVNNVQ